MGPDDQELVRRALQGEQAAFHELVDRHAGLLFGLAALLVGHAADAEDIVQETLSGAFRGLKAFRGQASVRTWLTRILIRQAAWHLRGRRRRRDSLRQQSLAARQYVASESQAADARMDVAEAIQALSPEHREVVVLRELEGLSYEQIADALDIPRGTVESRLFRARRSMQKLLKGYFADETSARESRCPGRKE